MQFTSKAPGRRYLRSATLAMLSSGSTRYNLSVKWHLPCRLCNVHGLLTIYVLCTPDTVQRCSLNLALFKTSKGDLTLFSDVNMCLFLPWRMTRSRWRWCTRRINSLSPSFLKSTVRSDLMNCQTCWFLIRQREIMIIMPEILPRTGPGVAL